MEALSLGPFVISTPRLLALAGLSVLLLLAELDARNGRRLSPAAGVPPATAAWAWNAALAVLIGARAGFVAENLTYFAREPLAALAFWQGGFSPWWGVAAGAAAAAVTLRRSGARLTVAALPASVALAVWLVAPALLTAVEVEPPDFPTGTLLTLAGEPFEFGGARSGPVVVNLWATWCIPCRREMPQLARAAKEHPGVLFLYVNQGEEPSAVAAFLEAHPGVQPEHVLLDDRLRVGTALGGVGLPTTYFFTGGGQHAKTHVGEISGAALARELGKLSLNGR